MDQKAEYLYIEDRHQTKRSIKAVGDPCPVNYLIIPETFRSSQRSIRRSLFCTLHFR